MDYFELFQENPGLFFLAIAISLVLTLFIYGAFPVIFAKTRKTPITKKKYKRLCYGINFIGVVFFVALNGASNGAPYILWTWVFSILDKSNVKKPPLQRRWLQRGLCCDYRFIVCIPRGRRLVKCQRFVKSFD